MEGKWRKPVRRKGKVKMMHLVIRSPDGQQGHGGTFFERLANCNSPNSLTLILIEGPTQLSIVHVEPQYILQGNLTLKCRNHIVLLICF